MISKDSIIKLALETINKVAKTKALKVDNKVDRDTSYFIKEFNTTEKLFFTYNIDKMKLLLYREDMYGNTSEYVVNIGYHTFFYCKDEKDVIKELTDIVNDFYYKAEFIVNNVYINDKFVSF